MSKTRMQTTSGLVLAISLGTGCAATPATSDPATASTTDSTSASDPRAVDQSIEQSLHKLNSLVVVSADDLVLNLPNEAYACYSLLCPAWRTAPAYFQERARQAPRLAKLASLAEQISHDPKLPPHEVSEANAALQSLSSLQIIRARMMVEAEPKNNANCYQPCKDKDPEAEALNRQRVSQIFALADAAAKSKL